MSLADKPCEPIWKTNDEDGFPSDRYLSTGLTFRERLIIALAGNASIIRGYENLSLDTPYYANLIIHQADAIIKELEAKQ